MKPKNDLFQLISSLTPTEKAYFKKFSGRHYKNNNTFRKLFDGIESFSKDSAYTDKQIKERYSNEKFVKQLGVTKIYLYNNILKSLNLYYSEDNIEIKLSMMINNAVILYRRGLYSQALKITNKAKELAERNDKPVKLLEAIRTERLALRVNTPLNEVSEVLMKNYDEEQEVLDKMKNISEYRKLYDRMVIHATAKGIEGVTEPGNTMNKLLSNRLLKNYKNAKYFQSRVIYLLMHCFINNLSGKTKTAYSYGIDCLELFGDSKENKQASAYEYILIMQELIHISNAEGRISDAQYYFSRLQNEQDKLLEDSPPKIRNFLKVRTLMGIMNINSAYGKNEKNLEVISQLIEITRLNESSSFRDEIIVTDFIASSVYFANSMFDNSLHHINRIFNSKAFELREDIQVSCRIINLMVHYELGNMGSLEYYIRSTYRYLKKRKKPSSFEKLVFEFLKKGNRVSEEKELKELFKETRLKLKNAEDTEPGLLHVIDLDAWLEGKITGKAYIDIINKKGYTQD